ncbi:hypothetical protein CI238_02661, partial [Colletotrichum incanum]
LSHQLPPHHIHNEVHSRSRCRRPRRRPGLLWPARVRHPLPARCHPQGRLRPDRHCLPVHRGEAAGPRPRRRLLPARCLQLGRPHQGPVRRRRRLRRLPGHRRLRPAHRFCFCFRRRLLRRRLCLRLRLWRRQLRSRLRQRERQWRRVLCCRVGFRCRHLRPQRHCLHQQRHSFCFAHRLYRQPLRHRRRCQCHHHSLWQRRPPRHRGRRRSGSCCHCWYRCCPVSGFDWWRNAGSVHVDEKGT